MDITVRQAWAVETGLRDGLHTMEILESLPFVRSVSITETRVSLAAEPYCAKVMDGEIELSESQPVLRLSTRKLLYRRCRR